MTTLKRTWRFLGRIGISSLLLFFFLLISLLGALLPQLPTSIADNPERLSAWLSSAQDRHGPVVNLLGRSGGFTLFRSPLFVVLLGLVVLSTLSCTLNRWRANWRRAFRRSARCRDTLLEPGPNVMAVSPVSPQRLRAALEDRGYRLQELVEGEVTHLRADRYGLSSLATLLTHLAVLLLVVGYALTGWLGWQEVIEVPPAQAVAVEHRAGLAIRNDGFDIEHYPDGSTADYVTQVALLQENQIVSQGEVSINGPLRYRGMGVTLAGFRGQAEGMVLVLQVTWDPGARVVLLGGLLLLAGVTVSVYLPHRRVYARVGHEQVLLTVRSSGRWDDAKAELVSLAREVGG